ncbi:hypothetical protein NEFER03_1038 [Nematocida sp. LUAm3]|nr:hypothetical protein NEFER03_1038 [Nematocida sp. LUAm3]KAI5175358.1 hypothetical protein NEFER02_1287 [Nematocida sp. LUAm2]KAI5177685.1 hypothetical protein NEFER01_0909 [Nematocida sp. LUAm1]
MIRANTLKLLSSETRCTFNIGYLPSPDIQKAFLLPEKVPVFVEIFCMSDLIPFCKNEPLFYIDGYLSIEGGVPLITPCPGIFFCEDAYLPTHEGEKIPSTSQIKAEVEKKLSSVVETAIRKSSRAYFNVKDAACARLAVFLIKINRCREALGCIKEQDRQEFIFSSCIPNTIYSTYCYSIIPEKEPHAQDKLVSLSSVLAGKHCTIVEDRVLCCIIVCLGMFTGISSPEILTLYSTMNISHEKESVFFYLYARQLGPKYMGSRSALLSHARNNFKCKTCSSSSQKETKKAIHTATSLSSSMEPEITPVICGIKVLSDIKEFSSEKSFCIDNKICMYAEERIIFSSSEITSIVAECAPKSLLLLTNNEKKAETSNLLSFEAIKRDKNQSVFFIPYSLTIKEIVMKKSEKTFREATEIQVKIVSSSSVKKLLTHRYYILPFILSSEIIEEKIILDRVSEYAGVQCAISEFSKRVSSSPICIRIPVNTPSGAFYKEMNLYWNTLPFFHAVDSGSFYTVKVLAPEDVIVSLSAGKKQVPSGSSFVVEKTKPSQKILWFLKSRSKFGVIIV